MKKTIQFLAIILLISFSSCEELEKATSTEFDTTQKGTIPVHVDAGIDVAFEDSVSIDIDNSQTHDYLNLIKTVTINSLTYKVTNFSGDPDGSVDADFTADGAVLASHDVVVKTTADSGMVYEITDTNALNTIASKLKNGDEVVFGMKGTSTSDGEMDFEVEITLDLTIKAGLL